MAKEILIKSNEGVNVYFALKEISLKGETVVEFPSGHKWSDGLSKPYIYGESYIAQIPEAVLAQLAALLIPADVEAQDEPPADAHPDTSAEV